MTGSTRAANAQIPSHLVPESIQQRFARINNRYRKCGELYVIAVSCDAVSQLEVVAKVIDQGFEAADAREIFLARRHHGAEHEVDLAAEPIDEHTRGEIGAVTHDLETRGKRPVGESAIQARDAAHFRIAKRA